MIITAPGSSTQLERSGTCGSQQLRNLMSSSSSAVSVRTASRLPPTPCWENTYRLEPRSKFLPNKVSGIISQVLRDALANKSYDAKKCAALSCELCDKIKAAVKQLDLPRYKIVSMVTIGQLRDEKGLRIASRCLWNPAFDSYASCSFKNSSLFAVGTVHACYFE